MGGDWTDLLIRWTPLIVFLLVVVWIVPTLKRQQARYAKHIAEVTALNEENRAIGRENQRIAHETLAVLQDIKALLKDGKS